MEKMDGKTMDIAAENVGKLKELFPEAFTEEGTTDEHGCTQINKRIDFDVLKELLGEYVSDKDERYSFTWNGKSKARMIAQTPSTGTLRPCKEESVDWDTTQNIFIEGDNLEVLKLLQKSYHKKVKMIYIDPPYNTGKDFVYKDNFKDNIKNYKEITGQVDGEGRNLSNNPETSGRYHTDWLNMMYPRLKLARSLLKDDGVIFISIDDNEVSNLRKMCDEIFGEENCFADMIVIRAEGGGLAKRVVKGHDNLLVYAKDVNKCNGIFKPKDIRGKIVEVEGQEFWIEEDWLRREFGKYGTCLYEEIEEIKGIEKKKEIDKGIEDGIYRLIPKENGHIVGRLRALDEDGTKFYSILKHLNKKGIESLEALGMNTYFDFPKPLSLLQELVLGTTLFTKSNAEIVLDFFSGSATTAHAVMQQNVKDGGNRKFIMIQLPETTDKKSEAFKAGYKTIADISKERIRRAAAKIKKENQPQINTDKHGSESDLFGQSGEKNNLRQSAKSADKLDLGFKVFKLDSTNIKPWEADFDMDEEFLNKMIGNIKEDRREEDVLYEILLKYGLDLTLPITEHAIAGQKVFDIGMGALIICLADAISLEVVEGIAMLKDELNPEIIRVVFKDSGFKDDVVKTNAVQILKTAGIVDVRSL